MMSVTHTTSRPGDSIDDILGPRSTRYFGDGFRRAIVTFLPDRTPGGRPEAPHRLTGFGSVHYPGAWSTKASGAQRIHLSTIDAYLLAVEATSLLLGGDPRRQPNRPPAGIRIRKCVIKAGHAPVEQRLDRVPVVATKIDSTRVSETMEHLVQIAVGGMHLFLTAGPATLLRSDRAGVTARMRTVPSDLHDVVVADDASSVAATAVYEDPLGTEGHGTRLTFVDAFAEMLQLGQVGLYSMDDISREHSHTLWMRTAHFTTTSPASTRTAGERVVVDIHHPRIVHMAGRRWRTATLISHRPAMSLSCSVAHALPTPAQSAEAS